MVIRDVTALPVTFPFEREPLSYCFVRVETDDGVVGYGECCDSFGCSFASVVAATINDAFRPLLVDEELVTVEPVAERLRAWTRRRLGDAWVAAQARSGVELALWDLVGKSTSRSVGDLVGRFRDRVEVYASSVFLEEGPPSWHADLLGPLLDGGVRKVKVRIGPRWREDLATLAELRGLLGDDVELMVDGSEIFTLPTALSVAERLGALGVGWFEEPLPVGETAAIEELVRRSPVPIAYGEHVFGVPEVLELVARSGADVVQVDAATAGGLLEAQRMALVAIAAGRRVVPHVAAGPIALAANLHLAASLAAVRLIEYPFPLAAAWPAFGGGAQLLPSALVDGTLAVPDGPGLGVELDEDAVARHPYQLIAPRRGLPDRFIGDR